MVSGRGEGIAKGVGMGGMLGKGVAIEVMGIVVGKCFGFSLGTIVGVMGLIVEEGVGSVDSSSSEFLSVRISIGVDVIF